MLNWSLRSRSLYVWWKGLKIVELPVSNTEQYRAALPLSRQNYLIAVKTITKTHFPKIRLAESSLIYEIVKGEAIPAIVRIPSSKMFHFRGHFHSGYSINGDRMKSCMSADRYQLCPKH